MTLFRVIFLHFFPNIFQFLQFFFQNKCLKTDIVYLLFFLESVNWCVVFSKIGDFIEILNVFFFRLKYVTNSRFKYQCHPSEIRQINDSNDKIWHLPNVYFFFYFTHLRSTLGNMHTLLRMRKVFRSNITNSSETVAVSKI